ncbi:cell division protein FtsL [Enterococcus saccharolyticus]|uniref:Cell division protein FtsL n=1 Tax=Enterococcus saccharolyticus subsp. saccharolyticus ATCC 43076 TaxID=1139996 RepID=S0N850_9ENTE|nr:cell division protein FtsL [Enterococcus saccharolyticus]EOT27991.1 cell division protein FtsL [Enterococcus saccharolyticus subsp. saccharolyticus ATCC 43076]EOT77369.1 cell division protein FtsL [Enterococcus saccharolyticus subsp. saccharolyticus ATCC 43076]OJG90855.1 cell division protein FtsL [Enterococcus saccharolyticus]
MAELNAHHEVPYEEHPNHEPSHTPERPEVVVVPLSPARKLSRITSMEKVISLSLLVALIALGVLMISLRTTISQVEHDVSILQDDVTTNEAEILQLEQEKNELSKSERIQKIAEEEGLSINSDNLRKVKK